MSQSVSARYQPDETFGVKNEVISPSVSVSDESVQSANLSRRWKNFQRLWKRLAGAVIREFAAEFEASLTQLVLHLEKFRNYSLTQAVMACANS